MTYRVTVMDEFFQLSMDGEFEASNKRQALKQARNFYENELDTNGNDLKVVDIKEVS